MKKIITIFSVFSILLVIFTGCDNFLNSNEDFNNLVETEINYAKAPLVNVLVGHNNDEFGTVGSGVVNYSLSAKVGYAFTVNFTLKASAGNFAGWNAYTKYDPDIPANCILLDDSFIEFVDNSKGKPNAKVIILKDTDEQIRLVPEVTEFPVMEVGVLSELAGVMPVPVSFNPPQPVKALTPGQEYSITATTTVDYGFAENPEDCWKVYRKDSLGNEIEIANGENITITKNTGTQLVNGRSQSTIYITVGEEFSGRFYVSPKLITYPSMKVEVENFDTSLVKMSHSGTVSMAKDIPYEISLQTDPTIGFKGWKLCKRNNNTLEEVEELFPADKRTTTKINSFSTFSDDYIKVSSPTYSVSETGKTAGKVNASIQVTLKADMDNLDYSYYLLPQFFKYPAVNIYFPDGYSSAGRFSLIGAGYIDNDTVRMMMDDYEYTLTYKTTEDFSFANPYWIVYETETPSKNLLNEEDSRIEIMESSITTDESGSSSCSLSVILKHNFGTSLNIKPVVSQKPSMNISFETGTPNGINFSLEGNTITSGSVNNKSIKMTAGKTYTATVNVPKGYSFEGWKLVREKSSMDKLNWITESTKTTTDIIDSAYLEFDSASLSENPADYIALSNAKYSFELEGRNAGTTKATVDIIFRKELSDFSLNLIPIIKAVPEISFATVNSDYGTLSPSSTDTRNLYTESKIDLAFKSTKLATVEKEIWKIKKWDPVTEAFSIDYSENVGYTSLDLTAALKDPILSEKEIIIYNNDNEPEIQPNSKGEYITTKNAVLYVNKMPDANLQVYVIPKVYNTINFVPVEFEEGSVSPADPLAIIINNDYNINFISSSGYGFNKWTVTTNGISVPVLSLPEASGEKGTSTNVFVLDLGSIQELTGTNSLANLRVTLNSNEAKLLAVIYNTNKIESQATEGMETVSAKFRIVRDTDSTIVVSPATTKHPYFNFSIADSTTGSISPAGRTLIKTDKEYELSLVTSKENGFTDWTFTKTGLGTTYEIISDPEANILGKERNYIFRTADPESTKNTAVYKNSIAVIYDEKLEIVESGSLMGKTSASFKIKFINPPEDYPLDIAPTVFPHPSLTVSDPSNVLQKITIESNTSLTGSISSTVISKSSGIEKDYTISVIPTETVGVYSQEYYSYSNENSWKVYKQDGTELTGTDVYFTTSSINNLSPVESAKANAAKVVISECVLEYYTETIFKAAAKVRINDSNSYIVKPNLFEQKYLTINSPIYERLGEVHGKITPPKQNVLFTAYKPLDYYMEFEDGYSFKNMSIKSNASVFKAYSVKDQAGIDITSTFDSTADNSNPAILFSKTTVNASELYGTVNIVNPKNLNNIEIMAILNNNHEPPVIGDVKLSSRFVTYEKSEEYNYKFYGESQISSYSQSIDSSGWNSSISRNFDLGETGGVSKGRYIIPREKLLDGLVHIDPKGNINTEANCQMSLIITGNSSSKEFIIKERLFYLPENMVLNKSGDIEKSDCELIEEGGKQFFNEKGEFIAEKEYKDAPFIKEVETIIPMSKIGQGKEIRDTDENDSTVTFEVGLNLEIPIGGVHQIAVYEKSQDNAVSEVPKTFYVEMERYTWKTDRRDCWLAGISGWSTKSEASFHNLLFQNTSITPFSTSVKFYNINLVPEDDIRNVLLGIKNKDNPSETKYCHIRSGDEVSIPLVNGHDANNRIDYTITGLKRNTAYMYSMTYFDDFGYSCIGGDMGYLIIDELVKTAFNKEFITKSVSEGELVIKTSRGLVYKSVYEYLNDSSCGEPVAIIFKTDAPSSDYDPSIDRVSEYELQKGNNILGVSLWQSDKIQWSATKISPDNNNYVEACKRFNQQAGIIYFYGSDAYGGNNFETIKNFIEENGKTFDAETYPALHYAHNYGAQQFKYKYASLVNGWYLPNFDEIFYLFYSSQLLKTFDLVNETLELLDADKLSDRSDYWTSSYYYKNKYGIAISENRFQGMCCDATEKKIVRPIYDFTNSNVLMED